MINDNVKPSATPVKKVDTLLWTLNLCFFSESYENYILGRSSDSFTVSVFPSDKNQTVTLRLETAFKELTAAGTVPDFHGIPY